MPCLVIIEGAAQGAHHPITQPLTSIGREETCTIQIVDQSVSRKHLQIRLDESLGRYVAADYRSAHGVFINDKQILLETALSDGDRIRIGQTTLVFLVGDLDQPSAIAAANKKKGEWKRSTLM